MVELNTDILWSHSKYNFLEIKEKKQVYIKSTKFNQNYKILPFECDILLLS